MGTSTSWIAVEGASVEEVARELRLTPGSADSPGYQAAMLPSGWVVLVRALEDDGVVANPALLETLSRSRRVVGVDEESHVMYSAAAAWNRGREVWAVIHSSEQARAHLAARGELPTGWAETRDERLAEQAEADAAGDDVDYVYEVPLEVAKLVVGFRLDSDDDDDLEYVTLVATAPKPWWKLW
jgi:hypothetical protein